MWKDLSNPYISDVKLFLKNYKHMKVLKMKLSKAKLAFDQLEKELTIIK